MSLSAIDDALGIKSSATDVEVISPSDRVVVNATSPSVITTHRTAEEDRQEDYEFVREKLRDTIESAADGFEEVMILAKEGESPRAFEVAANFAKSIADISKNLMDLHKATEKQSQPIPGMPMGHVTQVNNTIFSGTTAELLDHLKGIRNIN
jgi:gas vesicle protein